MKKLLPLVLLLLLTLSIAGCDNDSDNQSSSKSVHTENDFINNPGLSADITASICVTFLEPPDMGEDGSRMFSKNDDGDLGTDILPITFPTTTNLTLCWEDDNPGAEHTISILDTQGVETLFHKVNEDCEEAFIEQGDYFLKFTHDGKTNQEHTIYVRPANGSLADKSLSPFRFIPHFIDNAFAQPDNLGLMVGTDSCEGCDLRGGDFQYADLGGNNLKNTNLSNANLSNANLYRADLDGANTTNTDFSGATSPNGGTYPSGTFGSPNLNSMEHTITITNNCSESVWAGVVFGRPAQPFTPVNGGPPLWGTGNTPSWEIKSMATQTLNVPFGFTSAVITPRTGCVVDNMCCTDSNGTSCNVSTTCTTQNDCSQFNTCATHNCCTDSTGADCQVGTFCNADNDCIFNDCVTDVGLRCKVGTCNDFNNCGTGGAGAEPATTFEMSLDQDQGGGHFADFYNVSMVAGNHIRAKIEPSDMGCPSVGVCESEPVCPWSRVVQQQGEKIGILANYTVASDEEAGACLGPDKMVGNSRYSTLMEENPFQDLMKETDEFRRLGCVASEVPFTDKVCGATALENIFYGCSPFAVNAEIHKDDPAPPDGGEFGGCLSAFGPNSGCTLENCHPTLLTEKGLNDNKMAYSMNQICDPYGQCDQARNKTAKWPDGVWPVGCTVPGCNPGDPVNSTDYLESVKAACGTFDPSDQNFDPLKKGAYSWQFDDPSLPGLSGALGGCQSNQIEYTVTLCSD